MDDQSSILGKGNIFVLATVSRLALVARGSHPRGKAKGHETVHSPVCIAEVKNVQSYTSIPPIHFHNMVLS
jgi:hypothetical protein